MRWLLLTCWFIFIVVVVGKETSMGWGEYGLRLAVFAVAYAVLVAIYWRKALDRKVD